MLCILLLYFSVGKMVLVMQVGKGSEEGVPENLGVPLQGRPGSRGCIPDAPGETGIHLEVTSFEKSKL